MQTKKITLSTQNKIIIIASIILLLASVFFLETFSNIVYSQTKQEILTDKMSYTVNDVVVFQLSKVAHGDKGIMTILTPSGNVFSKHLLQEDGNIIPPTLELSQSSFFDCRCDAVGLWSIEYSPISGNKYVTRNFSVI